MTREEHLEFCTKCINREFSRNHGVICGITGKIADFEGECENYSVDSAAIDHGKEWEEPQKRKIRDCFIQCPICGGEEFSARRISTQTKTDILVGREYWSETATNYICSTCTHILWFKGG